MPATEGWSGKRPLTPVFVAAFFAFAAVISTAAGLTLLKPGGLFD